MKLYLSNQEFQLREDKIEIIYNFYNAASWDKVGQIEETYHINRQFIYDIRNCHNIKFC